MEERREGAHKGLAEVDGIGALGQARAEVAEELRRVVRRLAALEEEVDARREDAVLAGEGEAEVEGRRRDGARVRCVRDAADAVAAARLRRDDRQAEEALEEREDRVRVGVREQVGQEARDRAGLGDALARLAEEDDAGDAAPVLQLDRVERRRPRDEGPQALDQLGMLSQCPHRDRRGEQH